MFVQTDEFGLDTKMIEQPTGVSCVLGSDQGDLGEDAERAVRDVFEVADGC